jgi:hypothetical protein
LSHRILQGGREDGIWNIATEVEGKIVDDNILAILVSPHNLIQYLITDVNTPHQVLYDDVLRI